MDLTDDYENGKYIPNAASYPPKWSKAAQKFRAELGARATLDIPYGEKPRNRFDLFLPEGKPKGLLVFVHGGYWLKFDNRYWSHLAKGPLDHGWAVAMPSYTLAPEVRIAEITKEVARAVAQAAAQVAGPIVITGHSAGGHLSARMRSNGILPKEIAERVVRIVPISPVTDLRPLMHTAMNVELRVDAAEAEAESPVLLDDLLPVDCLVWVGAEERPAFLDQACWLTEAWDCPPRIMAGCHHFDVVEGMEKPNSSLTRSLLSGL